MTGLIGPIGEEINDTAQGFLTGSAIGTPATQPSMWVFLLLVIAMIIIVALLFFVSKRR